LLFFDILKNTGSGRAAGRSRRPPESAIERLKILMTSCAQTPPLFLCRRNRQQHIFGANLFRISILLSGVPLGAAALVPPAVSAYKCLQEVEQKNDPISISDSWSCQRPVARRRRGGLGQGRTETPPRDGYSAASRPTPLNHPKPRSRIPKLTTRYNYTPAWVISWAAWSREVGPVQGLFLQGGEPPIAQ
jgi:hypothetical protein